MQRSLGDWPLRSGVTRDMRVDASNNNHSEASADLPPEPSDASLSAAPRAVTPVTHLAAADFPDPDAFFARGLGANDTMILQAASDGSLLISDRKFLQYTTQQVVDAMTFLEPERGGERGAKRRKLRLRVADVRLLFANSLH